jgi:hypothetical protein
VAAITPLLSYSSTADRIDLRVGAEAVARIHRDDGRIRTSLVMLRGARLVDVTPQPRTVPTLLRREAGRRREDPDRWCRGVARLLFDDVATWGIGALPDGDRDDLDALLASATFPLGRLARADGAGPLPFVPRWAMPALLAPNPTAATRAMFGPTSTRGMARALASGLMPAEPAPAAAAPDLRPLGLAWSLRDVLDPDRLATVLAGNGRWQPPHHWPDDDDISNLGRIWPLIDPRTAVAVALDSLRIERGPARLRRALQIIEGAASVAEIVVARTVDGLERQAGEAAATGVDGHAVPRRPPPRADRLPAEPLTAPAGPRPDRRIETFAYPPTVEIAHGYRRGDHRFVLPRTPAELAGWGRRLSNCLPDYVEAVGVGRSIVIGLEERGVLVAALELPGASGSVRQFVGIANAQPSAIRRRAVRQMLADLGLGGG